MSRATCSLVALAIAGCFSKPSFQGAPDDARRDGSGPGSLVGVSILGDGTLQTAVVTGPEFEVQFPTTGVHLPDRLMLGDVDVLGRIPGCPNEDGVGLAVYPALSISATEGPAGITSSIRVIASGPAFVQVEVTYDAPFACAAPQQLHGTATFTAWPDGRIIRDDRIKPTISGTLMPGVCGCGNASASGDYFLTSYLTIQDQFFDQIVYDDGNVRTATNPLPEDPWIDLPNPDWVCLRGPDAARTHRRIGMTWRGPIPQNTNTGGTRIKPTPPSTTMIYDWIYGAQSIPSGERTMETAWFLGTGTDALCDDATMGPMVNAFSTPRRLAVALDGGTMMAVPLDRRTGIYTIAPAMPVTSYAIRVEADAEVPAGAAISVLFDSSAAPRLVVDGVALVEGDDYLRQVAMVSGRHVHTVWLAAPFGQTKQLTVTQ